MKVLVTGVAGFIGMHVAQRLLARGDEVVGLDNLNDYYDPQLKQARLDALAQNTAHAVFRFEKLDLGDTAGIMALFAAQRPRRFERVIHLAAQAGVRYSLVNPHAYAHSNLAGFLNILEACRQYGTEHLVYASSSSVYGANAKTPFSVHDAVDHPVSLYAATKKANELMAHSYSHLYGLPTTGLRYFTVYGPWGRPDMSPWLFSEAIFAGKPIQIFNHGKMRRDFTYIDDIAEGTIRVMDAIAQPDPGFDAEHPDPSRSRAPYRIYNIGTPQPVELMTFIETLENALGKTARKEFLPMQAGDVLETYADTDDLRRDIDFAPRTPLAEGLARWADWFRTYIHP
jgi:nucleoside-diphosphate-sugar epimerase